MKRELQTITIFAKACNIIRQLKSEHNLFTQIAPIQKFVMKTSSQIKASIARKNLPKISEVEEIKYEESSLKRVRKYHDISNYDEK
jgi:hypothetical protein